MCSKIVFLVVLSSNYQYYVTKIALKLHFKATLLFFISFLAVNLAQSHTITVNYYNLFTQLPDSTIIPIQKPDFELDTIVPQPDSLVFLNDTIAKKVDSQLKDPIFSDAQDSLLYSLDGKKVYLFGDAVVKYQNMELTAAYIEYDMETNLVFAEGRPDSTGTIVGKPVFKEGKQTFRMERMHYNFNTRKAKIIGVITEEAGGFLHSHDTKLMPDKSINISGGKFTTCDQDHPHFYISITKAKVIPGNKLITGPAYLVIEDVPFPLILPFGFFPNKQGRSSGIIIPEYGEERNRGFFLRSGGFYLGLNDYFDLKVTGDIYSKGSWATNFQTTYRKRYRYSGGFSFALSQNVIGERGFDDYFKDKSYWLTWNHAQDPKASPNSTFQARLNLGSPSHNRFNARSVDNFLANQISSSVSYSQTFPGKPFNLSASMNHSQNNLDSTITIGFPKVSFNMNRIYPFKRKSSIGAPTWYEKIGLSYTGSLDNTITTKTDSIFSRTTIDNMRNGVQHRIPVNTSFNILKFVTISPSANYSENWYTKTIEKRWDEETKKVVKEEVPGFKRAWQYNTAVSASTKIYGMFNFGSNSKVQAIRHVMTPSVSLSYRPDFSEESYGFFKTVQVDTTGRTAQYSIFEGSVYGGPGSGKSGLVNFSLGNNLEMKTLTSKDTTSNTRKIKLLESFSFSTSYNMLVDSMNWSPLQVSARTTLFEKFNINFSSTLDPYSLDERGVRTKYFQYEEGGFPFRLTNARAGVSFALKGGKEGSGDSRGGGMGQPDSMGGSRVFGDNIGDPTFGEALTTGFGDMEYVDFSVPWNLRVDYSFNYTKQRFDKNITQSMSFSGDLSLTPKWRVGFTSGYDFKNKKLTTTSLNFYRDLHCWEMRFTVIPIGFMRSFSFNINVKSGTLRDLKYTKTQSRYDY